MNGEEKEETRLLKRIKEHAASPSKDMGLTEDKSALVNEDVTDGSADEGSDYEQEMERSHDAELSDGGEQSPPTRGKTTGAQKGSNTARRRSGRVQRKAKC